MENLFTLLSTIVTLVIGMSQIHIARTVKKFTKSQDERDEKRHREMVFAKATEFIQKYSKPYYESDILLLPLCVTAYKYNHTYQYRREIYREYCLLTEEVRNEILEECNLKTLSQKTNTYYSDILDWIVSTIKEHYPNETCNFFYDNGKYLERAIVHHGNKPIPEPDCELNNIKKKLSDHIRGLLEDHKVQTPLSELFLYFRNSEEIIASFMCCEIAKTTAIYNCMDEPTIDTLGNIYDYDGQLYMEDLFLETLSIVEQYNIGRK